MITYEVVRWQNLLSTGNDWTEVRLDKDVSTLVIGLNGAGKSTMLDAFFLALFGKPFRKGLKKGQLVNSITGKSCLAEVEFRAKGKHYRIRQGIRPLVFEVYEDSVLLDQDSDKKHDQKWITSLIGMDYDSASHIVVLGKANYVPFMALPAGKRRDHVEEMLDIQIFSTMNSLLKDRKDASKERVTQAETNVRHVREKIEIQEKFSEQRRQEIQATITQKKSQFDALKEEYETLQKRLVVLEEKILLCDDLLNGKDEVETEIEHYTSQKARRRAHLAELRSQLEFLENNECCPTCNQDISEETKAARKETLLAEAAIDVDQIEFFDREIAHLNDEMFGYNKTENERSEHLAETKSAKQAIEIAVRQAKSVYNEIQTLKEKLEEKPEEGLKDDLEAALKELAAANKEAKVIGLAGSLLKDGGIKARIIRQYVPVINKLINKYLAEMDFFVSFEFDEEFNEILKSRYRDDFSYANFSEGEKMRIDLAILFTWRALARIRSRSSCNLLILDEVMDSSLDHQGVDDFLKIVDEVSDVNSVFVISHRGHQVMDKFSEVIKFEKIRNFSKIAA